MRRVRFSLILMTAVLAVACSKSGKSGQGSPDDYSDVAEGNIPVAQPGSELNDVNFAFDSSRLDPRSQSILRKNAEWIAANPGSNIVIEGHCDERGTAEYNLALGERRARSVYDFLRSLGVKGGQMNTISYGEELPLDPRSTESAWAKNRRAHFAIKN